MASVISNRSSFTNSQLPNLSPKLVWSTTTNPTSLRYIPSSRAAKKPTCIISMAGNDVDVVRAVSPCFSTNSDAKTFYSAVEVANVDVNEAPSPSTPGSDGQLSSLPMEKRDSGYAETETLVANPTDSSKPDRPNSKHRRRRQSSPKQPSSRSNSQNDQIDTRHSSRTRSATTSRRTSSLLVHRSTSSYTSLPSQSIPPRTSSSKMCPKRRKDLLSFHQSSCRLFQSIGGALADPEKAPVVAASDTSLSLHLNRAQTSNGVPRTKGPSCRTQTWRSYSTPHNKLPTGAFAPSEYSTLLSPPASPSPSQETRHYDSDPDEEVVPVEDPQPYRPVSATIIDWTTTETRKREYQKIDRCSSGLRGLWRKVMPKFCQSKGGRTLFFEDGKSDRGSVRRFRMDLPDEEVGRTMMRREIGASLE